jgi:hypothetical protein
MYAVLAAILAADPGRAVTVLTESAIEEPRSQRRFGPGVCGPADPAYIESATETMW